MDTIKHLIKPHVSKIVNAENEQAALVYAMYEIIEEYLEKIIDMIWCHGESKLAILGGIMINCDNIGTDRFLPIKFELRTKSEKRDIFIETFGTKTEENTDFIYENHNVISEGLMQKFSKGFANMLKMKILSAPPSK